MTSELARSQNIRDQGHRPVKVSNPRLFLCHDAQRMQAQYAATASASCYWLQLRYDFDSTAVQRLFDCLSKVINVTAT